MCVHSLCTSQSYGEEGGRRRVRRAKDSSGDWALDEPMIQGKLLSHHASARYSELRTHTALYTRTTLGTFRRSRLLISRCLSGGILT